MPLINGDFVEGLLKSGLGVPGKNSHRARMYTPVRARTDRISAMSQWYLCRKAAAGACDATQIMLGPTRLECKFLTGLATRILDESGWGVPDFPAAQQDLAKK